MEKICKKCNLNKPIKDFCKKSANKDGYNTYCNICMKQMCGDWYHKTKENRKDYYKKYREENKQYFNEYCNNHYHTKKELYREWNKNQYENNIEFRIKHIVTSRLHIALKTYNELKNNRTIEYLGCTIGEYRTYLESLFTPEMNWENQGSYWEIDHKNPIDSYNLHNPEELFECFHYTNTQPMYWEDNRKKSNKII